MTSLPAAHYVRVVEWYETKRERERERSLFPSSHSQAWRSSSATAAVCGKLATSEWRRRVAEAGGAGAARAALWVPPRRQQAGAAAAAASGATCGPSWSAVGRARVSVVPARSFATSTWRSSSLTGKRRCWCCATRWKCTGSTSSRWTKATFPRPCCKSWQKSTSQRHHHRSDGLGPVWNSRRAACCIGGMGALYRTCVFGTGICLRHSSRAPFSSGWPSVWKQFVA